MRYVTLIALILSLIATILEVIHTVHKLGEKNALEQVVVDGDFVVRMHGLKSSRRQRVLVRTRPEGRVWSMKVGVVNRGNVAIAARPKFTLVSGEYRFPVIECHGRAFSYPILPDGSARGVVVFDVGRHLVPERIEVDVDGDGSATGIGLEHTTRPP